MIAVTNGGGPHPGIGAVVANDIVRSGVGFRIADGKVKAMVKAPGDNEWTEHGETTMPGGIDKVKVGLFALQGDANAARWATFKDFVLKSGK